MKPLSSTAGPLHRQADGNDSGLVRSSLRKRLEDARAAGRIKEVLHMLKHARMEISISDAAIVRLERGMTYRLQGETSKDDDGTHAQCCLEAADREIRLALRACPHSNLIGLEAECLHELAEVHLQIGRLTGDDAKFEMAFAEAEKALKLNLANQDLANQVARNLDLLNRIDLRQM